MRTYPSVYYPELTDDRLTLVAAMLLEVRYETLREMTSPWDDNYTRESAVFGRSRNMLIELAQDSRYPWLSLTNAGLDVTFKIGRVPCRFFRDDPEGPAKHGFFKRNNVDDLLPIDDNDPVMWRFIVERSFEDDGEDRAFFMGYNAFQECISEWEYTSSTPAIYAIGGHAPPAVEIPSPTVEIRTEDDNARDGTAD